MVALAEAPRISETIQDAQARERYLRDLIQHQANCLRLWLELDEQRSAKSCGMSRNHLILMREELTKMTRKVLS